MTIFKTGEVIKGMKYRIFGTGITVGNLGNSCRKRQISSSVTHFILL